MILKRAVVIAGTLWLAFADGLKACSVCMGAADSPTAMAANGAIFLMLGFVATMLLSIAAFIVYLAKRSARPSAGLSPALAAPQGE